MKPKIPVYITLFVLLVVCLSSCVPEGHTVRQYGFLSGFVHGLVFVFALIGKLFGGDYGLYAVNNTGFFYWLGFIIGLGMIAGGGAASRR